MKSLKLIISPRFVSRARFYTNVETRKGLFKDDDSQSPGTTVDQADVQLHSKLTKEWWNTYGPMKALHAFNLLRVPFIRDGLVVEPVNGRTLTPLKGKTILDVGCGGGILSVPLARLGAEVTGIDASSELIEMATEHTASLIDIKKNQPNYICTTVEDHSRSYENYYDAVVASEIIEHVANQELFVRSCVNVLKPGGRIFFTTPNRTQLSNITVILLAENVFKTIPKGTHRIDKFIRPTELTFLLERNNCHVEIIHGIFYNVITNTWSWSKFQHFLFALQAVKLPESKD